MRLLGLFTNKTFRKNLELIFPHRDFIMCIVALAIFHPHFVIRILSSAFFHPHFIIRIFLSAIRRHPVRILLRPFYKRSNHELPVFSSTWAKYSFTPIPVITDHIFKESVLTLSLGLKMPLLTEDDNLLFPLQTISHF